MEADRGISAKGEEITFMGRTGDVKPKIHRLELSIISIFIFAKDIYSQFNTVQSAKLVTIVHHSPLSTPHSHQL